MAHKLWFTGCAALCVIALASFVWAAIDYYYFPIAFHTTPSLHMTTAEKEAMQPDVDFNLINLRAIRDHWKESLSACKDRERQGDERLCAEPQSELRTSENRLTRATWAARLRGFSIPDE